MLLSWREGSSGRGTWKYCDVLSCDVVSCHVMRCHVMYIHYLHRYGICGMRYAKFLFHNTIFFMYSYIMSSCCLPRSTDTGTSNKFGETGRVLTDKRTSSNAWCREDCLANPHVNRCVCEGGIYIYVCICVY